MTDQQMQAARAKLFEADDIRERLRIALDRIAQLEEQIIDLQSQIGSDVPAIKE